MCDIGLGTELCADARRVLKRLLVRGSRVVRKSFWNLKEMRHCHVVAEVLPILLFAIIW